MSRLLGAQTPVAKLSEDRFEVGELVIPAEARSNGPTCHNPERRRHARRNLRFTCQSTVIYTQATCQGETVPLIRVGVL